MTNLDVTFDERVMMYVAMGDKRKGYLNDWFRAYDMHVNNGWAIDNTAYWADKIMRINDAEIALRAMLAKTDEDATMAKVAA